ncbi:NAD(P)-dependent alcohol dehydrogenase [Paenibacillus sp. J22TS3]|uniref:NAD(P)-dependent alcohol dehydrogenase n=1 Tax=Paenibacillus sp. J22TS3 TaxID=2807192 RepID=UPI001B03416F|nr:NAD(P)-dependent alcohol dehydrogenase [Paenibacillus sp. J22TS3]GIP21133.1 NADPH:quinone reductase [Paenibacillus sp. J22TS3]
MRAMICTAYGSSDVLQLREVEKPVPRDKEVRIRVHKSTVTAGDIRIRAFQSPLLFWVPMRLVLGIRKPRQPILGAELAGEVESVGKDVKRFKKGDRVFALTGMRLGGHAEYTCLHEDARMAVIPANVSYEQAASLLFGGTTALYFLRKAGIQQGQKVLIYGGSGAVGTFAVQLAAYFGAEVTGVCSSGNLDLVKSLGAAHVIDYTKEDFAARGEQYDVIFDAVGKSSKSHCRNALVPGGSFVTVDGQGMAKVRNEDVHFLAELMEKGQLHSVIDRCYTLEQIPEAHRYVEKGHKKGSVIIAVSNDK